MGTRVMVLIGTRKGGFILESDEGRSDWTLRGPFCDGWEVSDMKYDPATGALIAAGGVGEWGSVPGVWRSTDLGKTWTGHSQGLTYGEGDLKVKKIWHLMPGHGALYAGVEPAGLFRSDDGGESWAHVSGLREHPSTPQWSGGSGGLCLHSIVPHHTDPNRMWVATSAAGTFYTEDGGRNWDHRNKNTRNPYDPNPDSEWGGRCVHKLVMAPGEPDLLYQQNHFGVYRSENDGRTWDEITEGLPSEFGFPMEVHPRDRNTVWVIPLTPDGRYMPDGQVAVWRSNNGGASWQQLTEGLPSQAYLGVLREGLAVDSLDRVGVYFGTSTGQIFASRNEGDSWTRIGDHLPGVLAVNVAVIEV